MLIRDGTAIALILVSDRCISRIRPPLFRRIFDLISCCLLGQDQKLLVNPFLTECTRGQISWALIRIGPISVIDIYGISVISKDKSYKEYIIDTSHRIFLIQQEAISEQRKRGEERRTNRMSRNEPTIWGPATYPPLRGIFFIRPIPDVSCSQSASGKERRTESDLSTPLYPPQSDQPLLWLNIRLPLLT